jgi:preprotein translocase subunit SecE
LAKAVRDNRRKPNKRTDTTRQGRSPAKASSKDQKQVKAPSRWARARQAARQTRTVRNASRPAAARAERRGFGKFIRDVRMEMAKVTWPTRKDLVQSTIVVIVAVIISGVFIGVLDLIFSRLINLFPFIK